MPRVLSAIKNNLVPKGAFPRKIRFGLLKGLFYKLDLTTDSQTVLGLSEIELARWLREFSVGIRTALDVGAAVGLYTVYFLKKTPAEKVFSFEPGDECIADLKANLALNQLADDPRLNFSNHFVGNRDDDQWTSLDSLAAEIQTPCLVKLDIEGGELDALHGAKELLERKQMRWIIECHSKELEIACTELLTARGYRLRPVGKSLMRLVVPEFRPAAYNSWIVADNG